MISLTLLHLALAIASSSQKETRKLTTIDEIKKAASVIGLKLGHPVKETEWQVENIHEKEMYVLTSMRYRACVFYSGSLLSFEDIKANNARYSSPSSERLDRTESQWYEAGQKVLQTVFPSEKVSPKKIQFRAFSKFGNKGEHRSNTVIMQYTTKVVNNQFRTFVVILARENGAFLDAFTGYTSQQVIQKEKRVPAGPKKPKTTGLTVGGLLFK